MSSAGLDFVKWNEPMNGKTKIVNGVDCPRHAFAFAPDELDTSTWILPIFIPGNSKKSLNALKTSLFRFDAAQIPASERERVWYTLYGAAKVRGIEVERRTFAAKNVAPVHLQSDSIRTADRIKSAPTTEPTPPVQVKVQKQVKKDPEIEAVIADADRRATALLRSLGYE